jgi:hypothetical protein
MTSPLQNPAGYCYVRFEVFMAMTVKNAVFWDVTLCGSCEKQRFGGTCRLRHQGEKNQQARNVTYSQRASVASSANIVP